MYEDKTLTCKDCGNEFVFTAGEQEFYAQKAFRTSQAGAGLQSSQKRGHKSFKANAHGSMRKLRRRSSRSF